MPCCILEFDIWKRGKREQIAAVLTGEANVPLIPGHPKSSMVETRKTSYKCQHATYTFPFETSKVIYQCDRDHRGHSTRIE